MTVVDCITHTHVCPKCQQEKPLTIEFFKIKRRHDRDTWKTDACRECVNAKKRANDAIREKAKIRMRELRATPEGRVLSNQKVREWKRRNPEKRQEERRKAKEKQGKIYIPRGLVRPQDIERAYDKIIVQNAREAFDWWFAKKSDQQVAAWYEATGKPWLNPRLSAAEVWKVKYDNDPEFHAYEVMRRQIKKVLYKDGIGDLMRQGLNTQGRSNRVEKLLGYTINDLRIHLERQFTKGMSWDKFIKGEIHIDHIHPKASFDFSNPDEWRVCWSLPNLRPLWARDNLKKGDKVLSLI